MLHLRMFSMSVCSHTYANMHKPYQAIRHMGIQAIKALFTTSIRRQYVGIHRHDPFAERASLYCRRDNTRRHLPTLPPTRFQACVETTTESFEMCTRQCPSWAALESDGSGQFRHR